MRQKRFWLTTSVLAMLAMALLQPTGTVAAGTYKVLHRFTGADGALPSSLIFDAAGNLYGTSSFGGNLSCNGGGGCGTVFKLAPNSDGSWTESVLHTFNHVDGYGPSGRLIFDMAGNLYGTTQFDGPNNGKGVVFKLTPNSDGSWTESVLHTFTGNDGDQPSGGVVFDAKGNLYGTTQYGGDGTGCSSGCGTVFKLQPNSDGSWTESVLHSFAIESDGGIPFARVIFDTAGNLYGTAAYGGPSKYGVVFKVQPISDGTWNYGLLYAFGGNGLGGGSPLAGLIFDPAGNIYGTTGGGGPLNDGTVFKLAPQSDGTWKESVLHAFLGKPGKQPNADLALDQAGNLYGTTLLGGLADSGVVFKLTPQSGGRWGCIALHVFKGGPALYPRGLVLDKAGNLYGSAQSCRRRRDCSGIAYQITP